MTPDLHPSSGSAFAAAVNWLETTLLGSFATVVAVIIIASFGLLLFLGRVPTRRAIELVFGCFILFGASSIASGIMRALYGAAVEPEDVAALPPPPPIEAPVQARSAQPYDPYAAAAVPRRH
jgi:type IV secretory pathway VirB2 component (pilin)